MLALPRGGARWRLGSDGRKPRACRTVDVIVDFDIRRLLRAYAGRWRYRSLVRDRCVAPRGRVRSTQYSARPEGIRVAR